jgi:hypothetical protein
MIKRPERSRLQTCIAGQVHEQVDLYCARYGIAEGRFFELAAIEKLGGSGDAKSITRLLRQINEQLEIISEHNHLFLQMWLKNTQLFSKAEQAAARSQITAQYQRFIEQLQANLMGGGGVLGTTRERLRSPAQRDTAARAPKNPARADGQPPAAPQ